MFYALTPLGVLALDSLLSARRPPRSKLAGVVLALAGVVLISVVMAAVGFLDRQPDLGLLFSVGMLLVLGGVLLVQRRNRHNNILFGNLDAKERNSKTTHGRNGMQRLAK